MKEIKILIIDDHSLVGEAWKSILLLESNFNVVGVVSDLETTKQTLLQTKIDVVLLDVNMQPVDGFDMAVEIKKTDPSVQILAVSMHNEPYIVKKMIRSGANGYVSKNAKKEEMVKAIQEIYAGGKFISSDVQEKFFEEALAAETPQTPFNLINRLTEKESEIIEFVKEGYNSREIAGKLKISYKTVQVHRHNILKKLHLKNTASLLNFLNSFNFSTK